LERKNPVISTQYSTETSAAAASYYGLQVQGQRLDVYVCPRDGIVGWAFNGEPVQVQLHPCSRQTLTGSTRG